MTARSRKTWTACGAAGLAAAVIGMMFELPLQYAMGSSPVVVLQSLIGGFIGRVAFHSGGKGMAAGVLIHIAISLVWATAYIQASRWLPILLRRPILCGAAYGALVYAVMTYVVVPLSALGAPAPLTLLQTLASLAVHMFAFGLPIAVVGWAMLQARD